MLTATGLRDGKVFVQGPLEEVGMLASQLVTKSIDFQMENRILVIPNARACEATGLRTGANTPAVLLMDASRVIVAVVDLDEHPTVTRLDEVADQVSIWAPGAVPPFEVRVPSGFTVQLGPGI